ncbi:hypothetical protein ITJ38_00440 [Agreia pratensis]|uniref:hypothetical protein n=1 Tax=Agreia pratensis TaxID=150121 RepID=UPI00188DC1F1|nr:hypothetical protein [Agreia pratensis]MBF4632866.1 hypothetical protein [Agreia pratensis]
MTMRGLILALTVFGTVLFTAAMLAIQASVYIANLPDSEAGLRWIIILIMVPSVITGIISGLTAGLGAYIGKRGSATTTGMPAERTRISFGAGVGGVLSGSLLLVYLSWFYQNGPGPWIGVLGFIVVFGAYAGFTAVWNARRSRVRSSR